MDLKKKVKGFFMLARKGDSGFTLVELIVVIAILAILGGVAVPAYSGYVKKAELAADEALLKEINTAFASACAVNGEDHYNRTDNPSLAADDGISLVIGNAEISDAFAGFFGSEDSEFKVMPILEIAYEEAFGGFQYTHGQITVVVNGVKYTADAESVTAYLNGTLGQNLTTSELLDIVNIVTNVLGNGFGDDDLAAALNSQSYKDAVVAALGLPEGTTYDDYIAAQKEATMQQYYKDNPDKDPKNPAVVNAAKKAADAKVAALEKNLLTLVGASKAEEAGKDIMTILKSETAKDTIVGNVNSTDNSVLGISQSALAYALYQSYAIGAGEEADVNGFRDALEGKDDGKFKAYLETEQASTDLNGVLGAMNVVSNQNPDTLESTLINGFDNEDLENALTQILGK